MAAIPSPGDPAPPPAPAARALRTLFYPACLIASPALGIAMLDAGLSPAAVVIANGLVFALVCLAVEFAAPETPLWRWSPLELRTDVLHAALSNTIPTALFRLLFQAALVGLAARAESLLGVALWPDAWPRPAQLALALVVAELASYSIHRFLHESRLWPLHAVHHSSRRFYFLLAVRKHPLQALLTYGWRLSLLWFLGVPADVLALYTGFTAANAYVQHANLRMHTGPLGWLFATPELHRLHHAREPGRANCNYGDVLIVWDVVFGTRVAPPPAGALHDGLGLEREVGQRYVDHLALPLRWTAAGPPPSSAPGPPPG